MPILQETIHAERSRSNLLFNKMLETGDWTMTCTLCQKDARYDLDISRRRFPLFRQSYVLALCDDHKVEVIKILDGMVAEYFISLGKESRVLERKRE